MGSKTHSNLKLEIQESKNLMTQGDAKSERRGAGYKCICKQNDPFKTHRVATGQCKCSQNNNFGLTPVVHKQSRKTIQANLWLCKDHPLSIETFMPLL